ncbi:MAG: NUDIX domain-containing protein [Patescibacteria group bacterium]|nr:NUDIX domain-containing protein [Patescibacteria group bacterium]
MEFIDIVNDQNQVIGKITKDKLYDSPNNHRIVHVLIFNDRGEMALQLRSQTVEFLPSHWTTVVGGHVQAGETAEQAAQREMKEEVGVDLPFEKLFETVYETPHLPGMKKFLTVFKAFFNGPFSPNPDDVAKVEFFSFDEIKQMIEQRKNLHQEMISVFNDLIAKQ